MDINKTQIEAVFSKYTESDRMPHAVLIEGSTSDARRYATEYLSRIAVCSCSTRPCDTCKNCTKALSGGHSDIYTAKTAGKTNSINIESIRDLIKDASIKPNEADTKVFILHDVDTSMSEIVQNAFLKVLEEPPQRTLFILTAKSSSRMLSTILSRVQVISLKNDDTVSEETRKLAKNIVEGILSLSEVKLLYATNKLNTRPLFKEVLGVVSEYLRLALNISVGAKCDNEYAVAIAKKLTKSKIIGLIEITSKAIIRADRNVNMNLLCTWLCGEYRRISWLR